MVDTGTYRLVTTSIAMLALTLTLVATVALDAVLPLGLAAVIAILTVGPAVHVVVGSRMERRPDRWGDLGSGLTVAGIAYPLLLWIGGTVYVALTRSLALAALIAVGPVVIFVVVALLWDENRGPLRRAEREGRALAREHGWRFVADGSDVLREHWASAPGEQPQVTASTVLVGEMDGWPVTVCHTVDHRTRSDTNLTVTWLVHLPVSLPRTVAVPYDSREFEHHAQGRPWEPTPVQGYPLSVQDLHLAGANPAFGDLVATPDVRKATIEGDIVFWRIIGRDLSLARRFAAGKPIEDVLRRLVTLAQALPADALAAYGTLPSQPPPFREPSPRDAGRRPSP